MNRKLRMGMIGGGQGAFIGAVHRMAAALDNQIELVCGAFSSTAEKSYASGKDLFLSENRVYANYEEMVLTEKALPVSERMDFVSIVTPNHMHFPPAKMALENGFHVICDKPLSFNLEQAIELESLVNETKLVFALTHNYTGYPMVKQAREMIKRNTLGNIRKVVVEYPQGWLSDLVEQTGQKQSLWRTDPEKSGAGGSIGDIGTHAANLAEYISGLEISEICADLTTFVKGRRLDDDVNILLHFNNGAKGIFHCSQVCAGEENALSIKIYGEKGGLEWHQQEPNSLVYIQKDESKQILRTGVGKLHDAANQHTRLPSGHPEGYLEAFANLYRNFAHAIQHKDDPAKLEKNLDFPSVYEGVRGMLFIEKVIASSKSDQKWTKMAF